MKSSVQLQQLCTVKLIVPDMTIVAIDGVPTNATLAKAVTIAAGQRYVTLADVRAQLI